MINFISFYFLLCMYRQLTKWQISNSASCISQVFSVLGLQLKTQSCIKLTVQLCRHQPRIGIYNLATGSTRDPFLLALECFQFSRVNYLYQILTYSRLKARFQLSCVCTHFLLTPGIISDKAKSLLCLGRQFHISTIDHYKINHL